MNTLIGCVAWLRFSVIFLGVMLLSQLGACRTVNTSAPAESRTRPDVVLDDRVITDNSLKAKAGVVEVIESRNASDLLQVQFTLANQTNKVRRVNYRVQWVKQNGFIVESPMTRSWRSVSLQGRQRRPIVATAPSPEAVSFKIELIEGR